MKVLVTGASGYLGSHSCLELLKAGHEVVGFDNFSNSSAESIKRVQKLAGRKMKLHELDLQDGRGLAKLFKSAKPDAVVHFAGLKAVGESVEKPLLYYRNNVAGSAVLLDVMRAAGCRSLVFSSSCTVYGEPEKVPVTESEPLKATNPYGRTKLIIEHMCRELAASEKGWEIMLLRYFNPIGAHESGEIGEDPVGIPNCLLPYLLQVAVGRRDKLKVFGDDYDTPDGTGIRDYIHVVDLAVGHVKALEKLKPGCQAVNLGTGRGYSVLEAVKMLSEVVGRDLPYEIVARRPGDVAQSYADPSLAKKVLGWTARRDLRKMCEDSWRWQSKNPRGYR